VQLAGVVVTGLGAVLIVWGFFSLGDALTPFPRPLDGAVLHRQGAFRLMRHPIYSGVVLASLGWTGWWLCWIGLLPVLALAIFFDRKAAHEETWLREKYRDYGDYARRVKKFIPGLY
jgi:protein-S-isoprenylcysteine O-methyltransferase Ste14